MNLSTLFVGTWNYHTNCCISVTIRYLESQSCKVVASSPKASWPCIEHNFSDAFSAVFMFCLLHSRGQGLITGHLFQLDSSVISKGPPRDFQFNSNWSETLCSCRLCFSVSPFHSIVDPDPWSRSWSCRPRGLTAMQQGGRLDPGRWTEVAWAWGGRHWFRQLTYHQVIQHHKTTLLHISQCWIKGFVGQLPKLSKVRIKKPLC